MHETINFEIKISWTKENSGATEKFIAEESRVLKEEFAQTKTSWKQDTESTEKKMEALQNKLEVVEYKLGLLEREKRKNKLIVTGLKTWTLPLKKN